MKTINLNYIEVDDKLLAKSGAQFKGRIVEDAGNVVKFELEKGKDVELPKGGQCILVVMGVQTGEMKVEMLTNTLTTLLTRSINKPTAEGRPTQQIGVEAMRVYGRAVEAIKGHDNGVIKIEPDDLVYLKSKVSKVELPADPQTALIVVDLVDALQRASDEKPEEGASDGKKD